MMKLFEFRNLNLSRPVYLAGEHVEVNLEDNVIKGKALFPSSDPSLADRKDGHVNLQHLDAVGANLFHALLAAKGEAKTVRVIKINNADFLKEVRQDTEIDVTLGYIASLTGYFRGGKPVHKGTLSGSLNGEELFKYSYDVVMW